MIDIIILSAIAVYAFIGIIVKYWFQKRRTVNGNISDGDKKFAFILGCIWFIAVPMYFFIAPKYRRKNLKKKMMTCSKSDGTPCNMSMSYCVLTGKIVKDEQE